MPASNDPKCVLCDESIARLAEEAKVTQLKYVVRLLKAVAQDSGVTFSPDVEAEVKAALAV